MQKAKSNKRSSLHVTPATTVGLTNTPSQRASPMMRSQVGSRRATLKSFEPSEQWVEDHWLYGKILSDLENVRILQNRFDANKTINTDRIDKALSSHLKREQQHIDFNLKYSIKQEKNHKSKPHAAISETKMQQDKQLLQHLMNNPEERSKIYENSLLQQYYLKDLQTQKTNVQYLKKDFAIVKHRKLTNNPKQREALYLKHDESEVEHVRLLNYVKQQKQVQQAVKRAKRNITYRKELNLQRINYIIECMVVKPLAENPIKSSSGPTGQNREILRKLFFRHSNVEGSQANIYTFMTLDRLDALFEQLALDKLPEAYHRQLFKRLIKFKTEKILYYLDFVELLRKVAVQLYPNNDKNLSLSEFISKHVKSNPSIYNSYAQDLQRAFSKDIDGFIQRSKIRYCISMIFNSMADRLQYGSVITLSVALETLSDHCLLESMQREKVLYYFKYLCVTDDGLNLQQFILMFCLIALSEELQLFKAKPEHMRKVVQAIISRNDDSKVIEHLRHYFFDRLKIFKKVLK